MKIINTIKNTKEYLKNIRLQNLSIGFVPTMGALHEGHLELIRKAKRENDFVVCSIFVNPIQFNNREDLEKYPRNLENDISELEKTGCDLLFSPSVKEMYPAPVKTKYDFGDLEKVMEGKHRPGHFNGVAIVVKKLFEIIKPDKSYFGEKDYQQLVIIHALVKKYKIPVEIVPCATVREPDGLAKSSRNKRLTPEERKIAPVIYQILKEVKNKAGKTPINELNKWVEQQINNCKGMKLEYFEIVDKKTLQPIERWENKDCIACIALFLGKVRLIDNIILM